MNNDGGNRLPLSIVADNMLGRPIERGLVAADQEAHEWEWTDQDRNNINTFWTNAAVNIFTKIRFVAA